MKATYAMKQEDIDLGYVDNAVEASGRSDDGTDLETTSNESTVLIDADAELSLFKTSDKWKIELQDAYPGQTIEYEFIVTNYGKTTIRDIVLEDDLSYQPAASGVVSDDDGSIGDTIDGEAAADVSASEAKVGSEDGGAASATDGIVDGGGEDSGGGTSDAEGDDAQEDGEPDVRAMGTKGNLFSFSVSYPNEDGVLAPGERAVGYARYTVTQEDIERGYVVNTAHVSGKTNVAREETPVSADASFATEIVSEDKLGLDKRGPERIDDVVEGTQIPYTFEIENKGNTRVSGLELIDELAGVEVRDAEKLTDLVLYPGDTVELEGIYVVSEEDIERGEVVNVAYANGFGTSEDGITSRKDTVETRLVVAPEPAAEGEAPAPIQALKEIIAPDEGETTEVPLSKTGVAFVGASAFAAFAIIASASAVIVLKRSRKEGRRSSTRKR